jgi:small subunit ribosomal protein S8
MKQSSITVNYPVGDFLIRIKNASMAKNKEVETKSNKQVLAIAKSLEKLGFLEEVKSADGVLKARLVFKHKRPLMINLKLVSKPGLRIYMTADELEKKKGPSIYLISTPLGIISARQAIKSRVGGEVIAEIW